MPALQVFLWEQPSVHCTKEMAGLQEQVDKNSPCYGCPYKKQEGYCFPCMKRILGKDGMEWGA